MHRLEQQYSLPAYDAEVLTFAGSDVVSLFEATATAASSADAKTVSNWVMGEVLALQKDGLSVGATMLAGVVDLVAESKISGKVGKELLARVARDGGDPAAIVEAEGLAQVDDEGALRTAIQQVLDASEKQVAQYRSGKESIVGYFVGQTMKGMQGRANPQKAKDLIIEMLGPIDG
jgi:aspartyl-tRNA(Asn)/glutamyl-tRNA(Gln) amidotransferase subunit B